MASKLAAPASSSRCCGSRSRRSRPGHGKCKVDGAHAAGQALDFASLTQNAHAVSWCLIGIQLAIALYCFCMGRGADRLEGEVSGTEANRSRDHFVTLEDTAKLLEAAPDAQWRLLISLWRLAGLRKMEVFSLLIS